MLRSISERMNRQTDVLITGAGCAGWFTSLFLAQYGITSVILDTKSPGAFASTRNQGWLQSGGFYAAVANDSVTARACRSGSRWIQEHYPEVVHPEIPCYFLMRDKKDLDHCLTRCYEEHIPAFPVPIRQVEANEPLLHGNPLRFAARMADIPVNSSKLLQVVAEQACQRGVVFQEVDDLATITPKWNGKSWRLELGSERQVIQAASLVLACGGYIPDMLQRCVPHASAEFMRTKTPILVLHGHIASSMLISIYSPQAPHLVPFRGRDGYGVNIGLCQVNAECRDSQDMLPPTNFLRQCRESLEDFYPGLIPLIKRQGPLPAHIYACQKLFFKEALAANPFSRTATHLAYATEEGGDPNLFVFYPGKFTAAPIVAQQCVEAVKRSLSTRRLSRSSVGEMTPAPKIARQRYYSPPQFLLTAQNDRLVFQDYSSIEL